MTDSPQQNYRTTQLLIRSLYVGSIVAGLLAVVSLAAFRSSATFILLLVLGAVGEVAAAQLLQLLMEIADHLAAIRGQVGKGVFGLLG